MTKASKSMDDLRRSSKEMGWSGAREIRKWRDDNAKLRSRSILQYRMHSLLGLSNGLRESCMSSIGKIEYHSDAEAEGDNSAS